MKKKFYIAAVAVLVLIGMLIVLTTSHKIEEKKKDLEILNTDEFTENIIREREEISEQIDALNELKIMASIYGFDISKPASNAKEAVQWLYFGYLGAIKDQNGAAMSIGRTSTFLDIYIERDLEGLQSVISANNK